MIVDLLASPAVAGFSVSKTKGQGPVVAPVWVVVGEWPGGAPAGGHEICWPLPVMLPSTAADIPTGDRAEQGSRPWSEPHRRVAVQGAVDQAHPGGVRRTDE